MINEILSLYILYKKYRIIHSFILSFRILQPVMLYQSVEWDLKTIYDLVNQRPPHLKFRGFPTLMASRFSKGAKHNPPTTTLLLLTFNLWPTHNLSPRNIGIQKDPKSWSLSFACSGTTTPCQKPILEDQKRVQCNVSSCGEE